MPGCSTYIPDAGEIDYIDKVYICKDDLNKINNINETINMIISSNKLGLLHKNTER